MDTADPHIAALSRRALLQAGGAIALSAIGSDPGLSAHYDARTKALPVLYSVESTADLGGREEVFFATNRDDAGSLDGKQHFGGGRGPLQYGSAMVAVTRRIDGSIPPAQIVKSSTQPSAALRFKSEKQQSKSPILYISASGTSFDRAIELAGQLAADLRMHPVVLVFSWPSQGRMMKFGEDIVEIQWATSDLTQVLQDILKSYSELQIVCEGLSANATCEALRSIHHSSNSASLNKIRDIALLAPAIERETMDEVFLPLAKSHSFSLTCYCLRKDNATYYYDAFRSGGNSVGNLGGGPYLRAGIDTVDISPTANSSFLNESGLLGLRPIASDLYSLLMQQKLAAHPDRRLRRRPMPNGVVWQLFPG